MKVQLAFISLMLVVSCTESSYDLKCTSKEVGILWPVYEDKSKFKECPTVGKSVVMNCNAGTQFTYVYQSCVLPEEYIPPPPLDKLPTDAPPTGPNTPTSPITIPTTPTTASTIPPLTLPTPQHPPFNQGPLSTTSTVSSSSSSSKSTHIGPPTPPAATTPLFGPPSPAATGVPMPETPMPTPPVIEKEPPTPPPTAAAG